MRVKPHIYLIFDKVKNQPYYIGKQTNQEASYITGSTYLKRYIQMYGRDKFWARFDRIILEYSTKESINILEEYYIQKYQTYKHKGNRTRGGKWDLVYRIPKKKIVCQYTLDGSFVKEWDSTTGPFNAGFVKNRDGVSACCRGKQKSSEGYIWKFKGDEAPIKQYSRASYPKNRKRIKPIEIEGVMYASLQDVINKLHTSFYHLKKQINLNKIKYKWL
jgi:hypothetical protein